MNEPLRPNSVSFFREGPPSPSILWAKGYIHPVNEDIVSEGLGILRVGFGPWAYDLNHDGDLVTERRVDSSPDHTRMSIGRLGGPALIKLQALLERPFAPNEAFRINDSLACAVRLLETNTRYSLVTAIEKETQIYEERVKASGLEIGNFAESIAVLRSNFGKLIREELPAKYLLIADEMEKLGISEISVGLDTDPTLLHNTYNSNSLRKLFAPPLIQEN